MDVSLVLFGGQLLAAAVVCFVGIMRLCHLVCNFLDERVAVVGALIGS